MKMEDYLVTHMKKFIQKLFLWWSYNKPKNNKKSIWKL